MPHFTTVTNMILISCSDAMIYAYLNIDDNNYELERLPRTSDKHSNDYKSFVKVFQANAQKLGIKFDVSSEVMKLCGIDEKIMIRKEDVEALVSIKDELVQTFALQPIDSAGLCANKFIAIIDRLENKINQ